MNKHLIKGKKTRLEKQTVQKIILLIFQMQVASNV